ncbi:DNA polymerase eta, partial [Zea mays]
DADLWKEAVRSEMESIMSNGTWEVVNRPYGCQPIGCKWIFKKKLRPDGTIERYKARLVAKGYTQNKTTFLNGELDEEIYMDQPEGFISPKVEQRRNPALRGQPTVVVQYNGWKGGGLIAVSYEARGFGVKRSMRGDEAKRVCPGINLVQVPVARGKANLNLYRSAGAEVVAILASKGKCERASIDEVYLDLTDAAKEMLLQAPPDSPEGIFMEATKSNILGLPADASEKEKNVRAWLCQSEADYQDKLLACGAIIVAQLRVRVLEETQFTCSAGIAHNKMLAKLVSGMYKPAQQTVVPSSSVQDLLASLPVKKMKQLGGKLGSSLQDDLGVETIGDLLSFTEEKLQEQYGVNTGFDHIIYLPTTI